MSEIRQIEENKPTEGKRRTCYPKRHEWDENSRVRESENCSYNWMDLKCKHCDRIKRDWLKDLSKLRALPVGSYFDTPKPYCPDDWSS